MSHARTATFALLASALLSGPALADDWKWDPKAHRQPPKVGRRTFDDYVETTSNKVTVQANGQVVQDQQESVTVAVRVIREILAVEGESASQQRFTIEKWSLKLGDAPEDKSLEGKTVLVEGVGEARKATIEGTPEPQVSDAARQWIEKEITSKGDEKDKKDEVFDPKEPVAPDGEWTIDAAALAQELFQAEIDPAKSSAKGKLTNVRTEEGRRVGKVTVDCAVQLKAVPGAPIEWSEGGLVKVLVDMEGCLEASADRLNGKIAMEVALAGKAQQQSPQGLVEISMDISMKRQGSAGEAPAK